MKIPVEIAEIITKIGVSDLSVSEKRQLLRWYQQLNTTSDWQPTEAAEAAIEAKIFSCIQKSIER